MSFVKRYLARAERYATVSAYINNQTDEEWLKLANRLAGQGPERIAVLVYRQENLAFGPIVEVSADKTQPVQSVQNLQDAICRAVTKWMIGTEDGKKAWEYSGGGDFNIGDLSTHVGDGENDDSELVRFLEDEGVKNLRISDLADTDDNWTYDTSLVNSGDVENAFNKDEDEDAED